jgi:hypothetical protein
VARRSRARNSRNGERFRHGRLAVSPVELGRRTHGHDNWSPGSFAYFERRNRRDPEPGEDCPDDIGARDDPLDPELPARIRDGHVAGPAVPEELDPDCGKAGAARIHDPADDDPGLHGTGQAIYLALMDICGEKTESNRSGEGAHGIPPF